MSFESPNSVTTTAGFVRAVVDSGAIETSYLLAGPRGGAPVLLVGPADESDVIHGSLLPALAPRFRVVAARPPADGSAVAFSTWLREFLDGLGVTRTSLVAEGPFGLPALGFALSDPARVDRLVLRFADAPDPSFPDAEVVDQLRRSGHQILVLRVSDVADPPAGADVGVVVRFLAGELEPAARR